MPGRNCPRAVEQAAHQIKDILAGMNKAAETVATVAFVIAGILLWRWILLGLVIIGALVVGAVIGYYSVLLPRLRQRRAAGLPQYTPGQVGAAAGSRELARTDSQPRAVDGGQHLHIHMPEGSTAADLARLLGRGDQR